MSTNDVSGAATCPLCGGPNDCGVAAGCESASDCWCGGRQFPQTLLNRVGERDAATPTCVCAACLNKAQALELPGPSDE